MVAELLAGAVITILLADDHEILRETLRRMLQNHTDLLIVGEACDGAEALELARRLHPDVAVVDIGMKEMNGIAVTSHLRRHSPETAVLILTVHNNKHYVTRAMEAGARGYLLKDCLDEEEFVMAIHAVRAGKRFFCPAIAAATDRGLSA